MRKIFDWTIGSFFRTFGRIIAFVVIGSLFALLVQKSGIKITDLLGISRVYAEENFSYSSSLWSYTSSNLNNCSVNGNNCFIDGYTSNIHLNTSSNADWINTIRFYTYATDTNKFKSTNFYNFKFQICQTEKDFNDIKSRGRAFAWGYNTSNAATGSTAGDPTQFSFKVDDIVDDNSCYYITFSAQPPVDSRYIGFWFSYSGYSDNTNIVVPNIGYFNYTGGSINVKSLDVTYSTDVNATINNSTSQIINNQNQNTQDIIDNQNQNTQDIIDNQNQNTQDMIDSQKVCRYIDKNSISIDNKLLSDDSGSIVDYTGFGITDYISIDANTEITVLTVRTGTAKTCFYNINKRVISCISNSNLSLGNLNIPSGAAFFRASINKNENKPTFNVCKNGNLAISDSIDDLGNTLTDDNISDSQYENALDIDTGNDVSFAPFSGFLLLPLTWIQTLLVPTDSCQSINIPLPYMENKYLTLPCMDNFWNSLGAVADLITLVWIAIVGVRIFNGLYVLTVETTSSEANAEHLYKIRSWEL